MRNSRAQALSLVNLDTPVSSSIVRSTNPTSSQVKVTVLDNASKITERVISAFCPWQKDRMLSPADKRSLLRAALIQSRTPVCRSFQLENLGTLVKNDAPGELGIMPL
ncbi:hypothetical protein ACA910_019767 [Epithemia clementina (nom. ined.)]